MRFISLHERPGRWIAAAVGMLVVICDLSGCSDAKSTEGFLEPRDVLAKDKRLIAWDVGAPICKEIAPVNIGTFEYRTSSREQDDAEVFIVPPSSVGFNGMMCKGGSDANIEFRDRVSPPLESDKTVLANAVRRMLAIVDRGDKGLKLLLGIAVLGAQPVAPGDAPICKFGDKESQWFLLRNVLFLTTEIEIRFPTPDPREVFLIRPGNLYVLANFDPPSHDANGSICVYSSKINSNSVSSINDSGNSPEDEDDSGNALSSGQVVGIVVGVLGVLLAVSIVLIGAYCWRRQPESSVSPTPDEGTVEESGSRF